VSQLTSREAWLWPEFGHFYPPLDGGKWESVGVMADKVTAWLLWQARGISPDRVLRPEHFEFRGASPRPASLPGGHTRRGDTLSVKADHLPEPTKVEKGEAGMSGGLTEFEATLLLKITQDPQVFGPEGSSKINVQAFNERDVPAWEGLQKHGLIKLTKKTDWQNAIGLVLDVIVSLTPLGRQKQAELRTGRPG
jgi:hypothetical protein